MITEKHRCQQPLKTHIHINEEYRSRIHERTILSRFLGIILRVLRLQCLCIQFLGHRERGMVFYQVFLLSPLHCTVTELKKLEEVAWVWKNRNLKAKLWIARRKTLKTFVRISSKNSASVYEVLLCPMSLKVINRLYIDLHAFLGTLDWWGGGGGRYSKV